MGTRPLQLSPNQGFATPTSTTTTIRKQPTRKSTRELTRDTLPENIRQILEDLITGAQQDQLVQTKDTAALSNIGQLQQVLSGLDPAQAAQRASGRVAAEGRKLTEQTLPRIFKESELVGTGGNALSQLLAQDAAIRTGEAQSRISEDAYSEAISRSIQGRDILNQLTRGTSSSQLQLQSLIDALKGSQLTETVGEEQEGTDNTTTTETTTTGGGGGGRYTRPEYSAPRSGYGSISQGGNAARALAAFMAAGGDPGALAYTPRDFGAGQKNRDLWGFLRDTLG